MSEVPTPSILVVAEPSERRDSIAAALSGLEDVVCADGMSGALEELNFAKPMLAVIDGALRDDDIAWILGALGDPDRALIWVTDIRPVLHECGAFVQIPYDAGEATLVAAASRMLILQRAKLENQRQRERIERFDHVMRTVTEVRHAASSPLTSLLAEAELLLAEEADLSAEGRRSVETMEEMSRRIRELMKRLRELNLGKE